MENTIYLGMETAQRFRVPRKEDSKEKRRRLMSLADSKTLENLKAAFAGESQANRRYLYFAQKADVL